jgi:type IV secretion system protein VirB9
MIRASLLALAAAAALGRPALALDLPPEGRGDANVRTVDYNAGRRWLLQGVIGRITTITFGPRESVYRVMFGPPGPWSSPAQADIKDAPLLNMLPIRAETTDPTILQVVTRTDDGDQRLYVFSLVAFEAPDAASCLPAPDIIRKAIPAGRPAEWCDPPNATYALNFTYSAEDRKAAILLARQRAPALQEQRNFRTATARLDTDLFGGKANWKYTATGDATKGDFQIAPTEVSDNTQSTKFRFPGNARTPSIFMIGPDGTEQAVRTVPVDDLLLVHATARQWVLRDGALVLGLTNLGYDPVGDNPGTGTTSPEVIRRVRQARPDAR